VSYYTTAGDNTIPGGDVWTGIAWALQTFNWRQHNANVSDTWIIGPNKVNQAWSALRVILAGG